MRGVGAGWVVAVLGDSGGGEQLSCLAEVCGAPLALVAFAIMQHLVVPVRRSAASSCFPLFQAMRTLNWKYHLGLVSLDVELADRTLSLSVSPVHAAIILHFQTKSESHRRPPIPVCFLWVAAGSESSGSRTKTWLLGLDLPQGSAKVSSSPQRAPSRTTAQRLATFRWSLHTAACS